MFKVLSIQGEHELCSLERLTEALSPHSSELLKLAGWKCEDVGRPKEEERESEVQCERLGVVMWGEVRCAHSAREMKGVKHSFMKTRARYYCILSLSHQNRFHEHTDVSNKVITLDNLPIDKRQGKSDIWVTKEPDNYWNGLKVVQKRENIAFNQAAASRVEKWNQHQDCSSFNDIQYNHLICNVTGSTACC